MFLPDLILNPFPLLIMLMITMMVVMMTVMVMVVMMEIVRIHSIKK